MKSQQNESYILITGASKRIGKHIAIHLAKQGYNIAIHYNHSKAQANETVNEILSLNVQCRAFQADISTEQGIEQLISSIKDSSISLCGLINNASCLINDSYKSQKDINKEIWNANMFVNFFAPSFLSLFFANNFKGGHIINILDQIVLHASSGFMSYTLAKSSLHSFTSNSALALGPNFKVNGIALGPTLKGTNESAAHFDDLCAKTPLQCNSSIEDILNYIDFLLNSKTVTGTTLAIDAGMHLIPNSY